PGYNPIFQVNFRVTAGEAPRPSLDGIVSTPLPVDPGLSRFDLAVELQQRPAGGFGGYLEYNTALFTPETARAAASGLIALLVDGLTRPDGPLDELSLAGPVAVPRRIRRSAG